MNLPAVDVVILTWNDGELIAEAVHSVLDSDGVEVRVWVMDNGSEPPAVVPADPRVHLARFPENLGTTVSRNRGAALGSAEYLCFLDSDAVVAPHSIERLVGVLVADPGVAMAVPVFAGQQPEASAGDAPTVRVKLERALNRRTTYIPSSCTDQSSGSWDVEFGIGACQVVRRADFEAIGGFDEAYFYAPEDVDLCLRLGDAGRRIVQVADTGVVHDPRRAFRKPLSARSFLHTRGLARHYFRRSLPGRFVTERLRAGR